MKQKDFSEELYQVIKTAGKGVLQNRKSFIGYLADMPSEYPKERRVMINSCGDNFFKVFSDAMDSSEQDLESATEKAKLILIDDSMLSEEAADTICGAMQNAIKKSNRDDQINEAIKEKDAIIKKQEEAIASANGAIAQLKHEIGKLADTKQRLSQELGDVIKLKDQLAVELKETQNSIRVIAADNADLSNEKEELKEQAESLLAELDNKTADLSVVSVNYENAKKEIDTLKSSLEIVQTELSDNKEKLSQINKDYLQVKQEKDDAVSALKKEVAAGQEVNQLLEKTSNELKAALEELNLSRKQIEESSEKIKNLESSNIAISEKLTDEKKSHASTIKELKAKETELEEITAQKKLAEESMQALAADNADLSNELDESKGIIESLHTELDNKKADLSVIHANHEKAKKELDTLRSQLSNAQTELSGSKKELYQVKEEHSKLKQEKDDTLSALERETAARQDAQLSLEKEKEELDKTVEKLSEYEKQSSSLSESIKTLESANEALKKELQDEKKQYSLIVAESKAKDKEIKEISAKSSRAEESLRKAQKKNDELKKKLSKAGKSERSGNDLGSEPVDSSSEPERSEASKSNSKIKKLIAAAMALVIICVGAGLYYCYSHPTVPELVGVDMKTAEKKASDRDLVISTSEDVFSESIEKGLVAEQKQDAGKRVRRGTEIIIAVSKGAPITVPDVTGKKSSAAKEMINNLGLKYEVSKKQYSDDVKKGAVISQEPEEGAEKGEGDTISVVLSKGVEKVKVPNVIGKTEKEATKTLEKAKLKVKTDKQYSSLFKKGAIMGQSIDPDKKVNKNTAITIYISKGAEPVKETYSNGYNSNNKSSGSGSSKNRKSKGKKSRKSKSDDDVPILI